MAHENLEVYSIVESLHLPSLFRFNHYFKYRLFS